MIIRKAENKDIEGILKLLLQVNQVHADGRPDLFKNGGIKYTHEALEEKFTRTNETVFVAVEEEEVRGYSFLEIVETIENTSLYPHTSLYIDDLCIDEKYRKHNIGSMLFEEIKKYAAELKVYNITLRVWECNPGAMKFYEKMGMKPLYTEMEMFY